jgi:translation elongation factor EF-1beta
MNRRRGISATVLAVLLGFALMASCRPSQTVGRQTDDASIKTRIKARLAADVGAETITSVEVNVTNGVVTLAGPVRTEDERSKIEATARSVEGVVSVTNNIQLSGEAVPPPQPATTSGPVMTPPSPGSTPPPAATPY